MSPAILTALVAVAFAGLAGLAGCGGDSAGDRAPREHIVLHPGGSTFPLGDGVEAGDALRCVTESGGPGGGGGVPLAGESVAASTGFSASTRADGTVVVRCPAHPEGL